VEVWCGHSCIFCEMGDLHLWWRFFFPRFGTLLFFSFYLSILFHGLLRQEGGDLSQPHVGICFGFCATLWLYTTTHTLVFRRIDRHDAGKGVFFWGVSGWDDSRQKGNRERDDIGYDDDEIYMSVYGNYTGFFLGGMNYYNGDVRMGMGLVMFSGGLSWGGFGLWGLVVLGGTVVRDVRL